MIRRQAEHFTLLGSPVYGRLTGQLAATGDFHGNRLDRLDGP